METTLDDNVTYHTGAIYTEKENDMSWLIKQGAFFDENETGQQRDQLYSNGIWSG